MTETEFQHELWKVLNAPGAQTRVDRQNAGRILDRDATGRVRGAMHGARKGSGDLAGWVRGPGWHIEVEVKVDEPWKTEQRARAKALARDGGIYVLVRWRPELDLAANVARGVELVAESIQRRRLTLGGYGVIGGDPR